MLTVFHMLGMTGTTKDQYLTTFCIEFNFRLLRNIRLFAYFIACCTCMIMSILSGSRPKTMNPTTFNDSKMSWILAMKTCTLKANRIHWTDRACVPSGELEPRVSRNQHLVHTNNKKCERRLDENYRKCNKTLENSVLAKEWFNFYHYYTSRQSYRTEWPLAVKTRPRHENVNTGKKEEDDVIRNVRRLKNRWIDSSITFLVWSAYMHGDVSSSNDCTHCSTFSEQNKKGERLEDKSVHQRHN